jgi:hypothetical protein
MFRLVSQKNTTDGGRADGRTAGGTGKLKLVPAFFAKIASAGFFLAQFGQSI